MPTSLERPRNVSDPRRGDLDLPGVPVSQSPLDKFREFLGVRGLKQTGERMRIVEHIFEKHDHFEADELVLGMKAKNLRVSRPTVYRTLSLLVEAGLLRKLQFGASTHYEHDYGYPQHEHLVCEKCGAVIEFVCEELAALQDKICREYHFRATNHKFIIQGVCERCNQTRTPRALRTRLDLI